MKKSPGTDLASIVVEFNPSVSMPRREAKSAPQPNPGGRAGQAKNRVPLFRPALVHSRTHATAECEPRCDQSNKNYDPRGRLRHIIRRRWRRTFGILSWIARLSRRPDRRHDDPRQIKGGNKRRQPFGYLRRKHGRRLIGDDRFDIFRNPPWLPWHRIIPGKPLGNGAGS